MVCLANCLFSCYFSFDRACLEVRVVLASWSWILTPAQHHWGGPRHICPGWWKAFLASFQPSLIEAYSSLFNLFLFLISEVDPVFSLSSDWCSILYRNSCEHRSSRMGIWEGLWDPFGCEARMAPNTMCKWKHTAPAHSYSYLNSRSLGIKCLIEGGKGLADWTSAVKNHHGRSEEYRTPAISHHTGDFKKHKKTGHAPGFKFSSQDMVRRLGNFLPDLLLPQNWRGQKSDTESGPIICGITMESEVINLLCSYVKAWSFIKRKHNPNGAHFRCKWTWPLCLLRARKHHFARRNSSSSPPWWKQALTCLETLWHLYFSKGWQYPSPNSTAQHGHHTSVKGWIPACPREKNTESNMKVTLHIKCMIGLMSTSRKLRNVSENGIWEGWTWGYLRGVIGLACLLRFPNMVLEGGLVSGLTPNKILWLGI